MTSAHLQLNHHPFFRMHVIMNTSGGGIFTLGDPNDPVCGVRIERCRIEHQDSWCEDSSIEWDSDSELIGDYIVISGSTVYERVVEWN